MAARSSAFGPGDGEEEGGVVERFDVVADGCAEREEIAGGELVWLAADVDAHMAGEDLDGDCAVGMMLFHVRAGLHGDEQDAEVVLLEKHLRVLA